MKLGDKMKDLKSIIAENIVNLRKENGLTQAQLAESLNYSDKAVSKWERGESLPDVSVLKEVAGIFNVSVDYLLESDHQKETVKKAAVNRKKFRQRALITAMSVMLVFLVASVVFFILDTVTSLSSHWLAFVFAVPVSLLVWLIFNSIWFNPRRNYFIISTLLWSTLGSLFITFFSLRLWLLFIVGVPAQIIIFLWSGMQGRDD